MKGASSGVIAATLSGVFLLGACALFTTGTPANAKGQLFCAKAVASGPLVVAVTDALGVPILATGALAATVNAVCAAIGGTPVSPPAGTAPSIAAPVTVAPNGTVTVVPPAS